MSNKDFDTWIREFPGNQRELLAAVREVWTNTMQGMADAEVHEALRLLRRSVKSKKLRGPLEELVVELRRDGQGASAPLPGKASVVAESRARRKQWEKPAVSKPAGRPVSMTEDQLDEVLQTRATLASGGRYGPGCLVFEGDVVIDGDHWLDDDHYRELRLVSADDRLVATGSEDLATIAVLGDVTIRGEARITDMLWCLVVAGNLTAETLAVFHTEVLVYGDLRVAQLEDHDGLVKVLGTRRVSHVLQR